MHPRLIHIFIILLMFFLVGCSPDAAAPKKTPTAAVTRAPTALPLPPTRTPITGPAYDNPVYNRDFPDPFVLRVGDTYYAYSTNTANANTPAIRSTDLSHWDWLGEVLPGLPEWVELNEPRIWAPGVIKIGDAFVLYYVAHDKESDKQCISRAVSNSPEGLFKDDSTAAFICQKDLGGSIDPYPFADVDGKLYIYWKNDGNCCGIEVALWVQPLSADGLSLEGEPTSLLVRDQPWERPLIENPAMVYDGNRYYLFYSANRWESLFYAVSYATCDSATGPCKKPLDHPIFQYTKKVMGPGGETFFTDPKGNFWMAYHAWTAPDVGYPGGARSFRIDPVKFVDGAPVMQGPTDDPQPIP
ncbi:MAG: glycoside hydrolase family 43 protein [Anaerolineaceae bacterium]|nr:glycoside hydrolase family 43 protein [Anaerolineaceae bacterium]